MIQTSILEKRIKDLEKENAELKRQLEIRPKRANTRFDVALASEKIIEMLKEKFFRNEQIEDILNEALYQLHKLDS